MPYFTVSELYKAYRKAKSDAFYDKDNFDAIAYVKFEQDLEKNLRRLLAKLEAPDCQWSNSSGFIGSYSFVPKEVDPAPPSVDREIHFATLDPLRDWEQQAAKGKKRISTSFRQVMRPTVEFQVLSALWLIKVGDKFDRAVNKQLSFAHNLRRVGSNGPIAMDANGLFVPYIGGYKSWRQRGLDRMREALEGGRAIVAITMDVRRFYHNVAPDFLLRKEFQKRLLIPLSEDDKRFTQNLVDSLKHWYSGTPDHRLRPEGALPVGLSASRVVSNVLLAEFDRVVSRRLKTIYYGRYADDIFLVVEQPSGVSSGEDFVRWMRHTLEGWVKLTREEDGSGLKLDLPYARDSEIVFSSKKQKIFFLSGEHGVDLLDQIADKIQEQSSQFRKLPELPSSESKMAARALLATPDARLEADSLRKAEAVSIRRFGFSMLLTDVEAYARDLDPNDWRPMRKKFYGLVGRYVLTPSGFFDYFYYIVRVFGLMISCRDFDSAHLLLDQLKLVVGVLKRTTTADTTQREEFHAATSEYRRGLFQAALQASTVSGFRVTPAYVKLLGRVARRPSAVSITGVKAISRALLKTDLGRRPYFDYWFVESKVERGQPSLPNDFAVRRIVAMTRQFRGKIGGLKAPYWRAIAFPTRPIPLWSICIAAPNLMLEEGGLEDVLQATRGAMVNPKYSRHRFIHADDSGSHIVRVPGSDSSEKRFGVPSFLAEHDDWLAAVDARPAFKLDRYRKIHRLINLMLEHDSKIDYIAFPESSLPFRWALPIAYKLGLRGVSFIAGIESRGPLGHYTNDALVSLASDYFGRAGSLCFIQSKMELAHRETLECSGLNFKKPSPVVARPIYVHGEFCFGVLICSDLTNIGNRAHFQGEVDALFVLEWNRDLSTFEFLVESSAHDLHAAVVQVNNREYGDSRIRVPYADPHKRDLVQVRGGDSDFFVTASVDFAALREFQRFGGGEKPKFKPTPIGYQMSDRRFGSKEFAGW